MIVQNFEDLIGKTPLFRLKNMEEAIGSKAKIVAKMEHLNPTGSAKVRVAMQMIRDAESQGLLSSGSTIIEPTSGNTGISLAALAASKGYKAILTMPETMSVERQRLLKALGAEVVLTPGDRGMDGAIEKAKELNESIPKSFLPGQFDSPSNPKAHFLTTGPEIWEDSNGAVDAFVCTVGTGGTITGVGEYLKSKNKNIHIVAVEPKASPVLSGGEKGPHGIQGIGAGFIPAILNTNIYDAVSCKTEKESYRAARLLATKEGILAGISSGAALSCAMDLAKEERFLSKTIVVLLPDTGDRYLSTELFS